MHIQSLGLGNKAMDVDKAMTWTALDASGIMGEGKTRLECGLYESGEEPLEATQQSCSGDIDTSGSRGFQVMKNWLKFSLFIFEHQYSIPSSC